MKLDIWHNILWTAYKADVFAALARACDEQGVRLTVYHISETERRRNPLGEPEVARHSYPMKLLFAGNREAIGAWTLLREAGRLAATTDADVTILAGIDSAAYWLQAAILRLRGRWLGVFYDSTRHDRRRSWLNRLGKRLAFALFGDVLCYGERSREYLRSLGVPAGRIHLRNQAAALPRDYDAAAIAGLRAVRAAPAQSPLFLYVGRLAREKGLDELLRAFASARAVLPAARLRLVGGGPLEDDLRHQATALGCGTAVEFAGPARGAQLYEHLLSATALILPSASEPWGIVVNEALHFGCPVIVSHRCGCVPELVQGSPAGMVVPFGDTPALCAALVAAPERWQDAATVAADCLARIAPYSPASSASAILQAALAISGRDRPGRAAAADRLSPPPR